ncbi:monofunctional biosynthetic peptidoglycan transglycosylase [Formosimonas limnophila]|uniref:Biosynthetic peptidoglycan transglycosylase n=1 Tax=Formosimonas limnophila TaxID=1384487 RepID=A0A8J3CI52_9BURK|nr:monofunctional biosynthetic peptidoglycan transglycosylase [Formosimonas limnophila]GHA75413.1 monofunctional biosynthetic peptidoglycan transglycosylase [Formosimonas limnophila]
MWRNWIKPFVLSLLAILVVFQLWCFAWVGLYRLGLAPYTAFMKSEQMRLLTEKGRLGIEHDWVDYSEISDNLKRAVIASEDAGFVEHDGVDWNAIEVARKKNDKAGKAVAGGSTISMQLTKNLFLSSNKSYLRKAEEIGMTYAMEVMLPKEQILEIYLNSVEWGEGVFGAEAAAQHYFKTTAAKLTAQQAAKLAVMLPAPKKYDANRKSPYLAKRANVILKRMRAAQIPDGEGV